MGERSTVSFSLCYFLSFPKGLFKFDGQEAFFTNSTTSAGGVHPTRGLLLRVYLESRPIDPPLRFLSYSQHLLIAPDAPLPKVIKKPKQTANKKKEEIFFKSPIVVNHHRPE